MRALIEERINILKIRNILKNKLFQSFENSEKKVQLLFRVRANPSIAILESILVAGEHLEWADIGTPLENKRKPPRRVLDNISDGPRHSQQLRCRIFNVFIVSIRSDHDMSD